MGTLLRLESLPGEEESHFSRHGQTLCGQRVCLLLVTWVAALGHGEAFRTLLSPEGRQRFPPSRQNLDTLSTGEAAGTPAVAPSGEVTAPVSL